MTQILANLMENKQTVTYCSVVAVLVLVGLAKKRSGHYAILRILSLRSSSSFEPEPSVQLSQDFPTAPLPQLMCQ